MPTFVTIVVAVALVALTGCQPEKATTDTRTSIIIEQSTNSELEAFFAHPRDVNQELMSPGRETSWMHFITLHQEGPKLLVSDAFSIPDQSSGLTLDLPPGDYHVWVKGIDYGFERRLSRIRYCRETEPLRIGNRIGDMSTDSASTGVCDLSRLLRCCGGDRLQIKRLVNQQVSELGCFGVVRLDHASFPVFGSGFGDGVYPVYELLSHDRRVGIEIEFIAAAAEYPKRLYHAAMQERIYRSRRP